MLITLEHVIKHNLPALLERPENWDSLVIDRRKPETFRVFMHFIDIDVRICLHRFNVCARHESFYHPHPWPAAFKILKGSYHMQTGMSLDRTSEPRDVSEAVFAAGSKYAITDPMTWHKITPLETTYTVMVNRAPWPKEIAHTEIRTTAGKDLGKLSPEELIEHLNTFKGLINV